MLAAFFVFGSVVPQTGDADIVLCGGAEASITPLSFAGFNALKALALGFNDRPKEACRPFDKDRAGFVMGEGAGVIVLETEEHAVRRGAQKVYGQLAGYGATCDAHHITAPSPGGEGLARCMQLALENAGDSTPPTAAVAAAATSDPAIRATQAAAAASASAESVHEQQQKQKQGLEQKKNQQHEQQQHRHTPLLVLPLLLRLLVLLFLLLAMTGHCLGGTGGIETVVAAKVLETGSVPPTLNYRTPDPECDLNYVPNQAVHVKEPMKVGTGNSSSSSNNNSSSRTYSDRKTLLSLHSISPVLCPGLARRACLAAVVSR
ncbi:hypothetical protein ACSSS7_006987 [Eimeria intestinalis]